MILFDLKSPDTKLPVPSSKVDLKRPVRILSDFERGGGPSKFILGKSQTPHSTATLKTPPDIFQELPTMTDIVGALKTIPTESNY